MPDTSTVLETETETETETDERAAPEPAPDLAELVEADLLVEDVSIDGMCGVY